eukprot:CAMPEP_0174831188 /NCGR_PEP_ID=MMETSP1114-20130205/2958_1 /TAXON_ID=312471 /ORGANISM="Neobodo designis, Strain CCAP 1951/1" /LENGTH=167 /DNA_ID=CAMNT_0016065009 /DNA_START=785 /DNA_END=1288 /DNA_ORIENTATION=-
MACDSIPGEFGGVEPALLGTQRRVRQAWRQQRDQWQRCALGQWGQRARHVVAAVKPQADAHIGGRGGSPGGRTVVGGGCVGGRRVRFAELARGAGGVRRSAQAAGGHRGGRLVGVVAAAAVAGVARPLVLVKRDGRLVVERRGGRRLPLRLEAFIRMDAVRRARRLR